MILKNPALPPASKAQQQKEFRSMGIDKSFGPVHTQLTYKNSVTIPQESKRRSLLVSPRSGSSINPILMPSASPFAYDSYSKSTKHQQARTKALSKIQQGDETVIVRERIE